MKVRFERNRTSTIVVMYSLIYTFLVLVLVAGNQTAASYQLSSAISEISNILEKLSHTNTHTHIITHSHSSPHSHHSGHHQEDFKKHHIYDLSNCPPGLMC